MEINMQGKNVLVKKIDESRKTEGGIYIPSDVESDKIKKVKVLAVNENNVEDIHPGDVIYVLWDRRVDIMDPDTGDDMLSIIQGADLQHDGDLLFKVM